MIDYDFVNFRHYTSKVEKLGSKISQFILYRDYNKSALAFGECFEDPSGSVVLELFGGLNGSGLWKDYFHDLSDLIGSIVNSISEIKDVRLLFMDTDCIDDMFKAYFELVTG